MDYVLKKVGLVAVATIGLSLAATPAFATPATPGTNHVAVAKPRCGVPSTCDPEPTFGTAYWTFIDGGADLGRGAAEIIAAAYTGIALTPALIARSFTPNCGGDC
jgi:hypothetical protein